MPPAVEKSPPALDLGCGGGGLSQNVPVAYLGLDLATHPAWTRPRPQPAAHFAVASAEALPLRTASLELVLSSSALEHIANLPAALAESARVLKPGGRALHAVPAPWSLFLYHFHGYRRFDPIQLERIFAQAGFRIDELECHGGLATFALHFTLVTVPELVFRKNLRQGPLRAAYRELLRLALRADRWLPFCPAAYGVVATRLP